jgi:Zn-dependent protease
MVGGPITPYILQLLIVFASVNVCMAIFNLLPIYPLDGYQMLYSVLPSKQAVQFAKSAPYGPFIVLVLFFFVPFLANIAGLGNVPIFHLSEYIWLGSMLLIAPISGGDLVGYYLQP